MSGASTGVAPRAVTSAASWSWQMRRITVSNASQATSTRWPRSGWARACVSIHCASSVGVEAHPAASAATVAARVRESGRKVMAALECAMTSKHRAPEGRRFSAACAATR
jgi:hypothetical protein